MLQTEEEYKIILNTFRIRILTKGCCRCNEKIVDIQSNFVSCTNSICKYRYSIYKNTIFYNCKMKIKTYLKIIDSVLNFLSSDYKSKIVGISRTMVGKLIS